MRVGSLAATDLGYDGVGSSGQTLGSFGRDARPVEGFRFSRTAGQQAFVTFSSPNSVMGLHSRISD
jgi:hypothetical protein